MGSTVLVSAFHVSVCWVGWVLVLASWVGLGEEKWTHVHLCYVLPVLWMTSYLLKSQGCSTSPPS